MEFFKWTEENHDIRGIVEILEGTATTPAWEQA